MSRLNGKGATDDGLEIGRKLGNCRKKSAEQPSEFLLGEGMGKRRNAGLLNMTKNTNK